MAFKNRKKVEDDRDDKPVSLKDGVKHTIAGIALVLSGIFLSLAAFEKAGPVGIYIYKGLTYLFGTGYWLLPIVCVLLALSFFRTQKPKILFLRLIGMLLFLISGLGLLSQGFADKTGGIIGWVMKNFLTGLFGTATWVILSALALISLVLIFETVITLPEKLTWFGRKKALENENQSQENLDDNSDDEETEVADYVGSNTKIGSAVNTIKEKAKNLINKKDSLEEFVPLLRIDREPYIPPPLELLGRDSGKPGAGDIKANSNIIKRTLSNFGIEVEMDEISIGPSITRYALKPAEGMKLSRIVALQNDLALALAAHPLRVEAPIPGKSLVGIEVPNNIKTTVRLGTLLSETAYQTSDKQLCVALGKNISGVAQFADIAKAPHLLIAGTTGSGKSVTIHALILALLYRNAPDNLRFIMIDPKRVELTLYNQIPHLLTPVVTNAKKAILALKWAAKEMDRRYDILEAEQARDIKSYHENVYRPALEEYNKKIDAPNISEEKREHLEAGLPEQMPYIVIVIDELADIMSAYPRELEAVIVRVAQMSRAVGIHLILSTQRPSTEVITGLIKANVPTRVALQVPSQIDSRTIIDMPGAEKLLGAGDMLYLSGETSKPVRLQSAFVSEGEVKNVVEFLRKNNAPVDAVVAGLEISDNSKNNSFGFSELNDEENSSDGDDDELYEEAREIVQNNNRASSSLLQRKLKVGYARAARLLDMLEERGVVGPGSGAKAREVFGGKSTTDEYGAEFDNIQKNQTET